MSVGDRIRQARMRKDLLQSELAEKAGVSRVSIGFYERDERIPPSDVIVRIAKVLEVPIQYLLLGSWKKSDDERWDEVYSVLEVAGFDVDNESSIYYKLSHPDYDIPHYEKADDLFSIVENVIADANSRKEQYLKNRLLSEFQPNYEDERIKADEESYEE